MRIFHHVDGNVSSRASCGTEWDLPIDNGPILSPSFLCGRLLCQEGDISIGCAVCSALLVLYLAGFQGLGCTVCQSRILGRTTVLVRSGLRGLLYKKRLELVGTSFCSRVSNVLDTAPKMVHDAVYQTTIASNGKMLYST